MINKSGFNLKTSADKNSNGEKAKGTKDDGELINPGATVEMVAGKNMSVKQDADGKVTYATKEDVEFTSVKLGKAEENGKQPVNLKTENATPADNNQDSKAPTTALNFSSGEGDKATPTQLKGVGSVLNTKKVPTAPEGKTTPEDKQPKLVNLGSEDAPLSDDVLNSAATVRDLANMGWVVGAPENGYVDTVKNANKVDFKGENGISVTGKTNDKGVREITISVAEGKVTNDVTVTKADGTVINGVKGPDGKLYEKGQDGKPDISKPITLAEGDKVNNEGSKFVSGNAVATAIQESGWNIGKAEAKDVTKVFEKEVKVHDKVNPNDDVKFVDGQNTVVKMVTVDAKNEDGSKKATTFVKVDVTGLPVQYTDKNGTPVTKVGDQYFTIDEKGNPTTTEVKPADLTTNMVNPAAAPNKIGAPMALGNVKSNLPETKNGNNPTLNQAAPTDEDAAKVKNNAATVSDVLNAGWNLQNNGKAKDFVKPYDTVNFVDGKGTKAVVETAPNGTTSNVKFDIDTGKITNNDDGSVQGPVVTPEMQKALKDAKEALNSLPTTAPEAVRKAAEQAVADAENNIANVANKVATAQDVANAINKSGFTLTTSANGGEKISGTPEMINPGKKVEMVAGKNMTVKQESNGKVTYATASNVTFDSVQFGDNGPKITNNGGNINVGTATGAPTKITGVAPGEISSTSTDAINGSQLHSVASDINNRIGSLDNKIDMADKNLRGGVAQAIAAAGLVQAYLPGKSLLAIGGGVYRGEAGYAIGYSSISDNGNWIIKGTASGNSRGHFGASTSVGYQW
ncbi:YadA-like family protein [Neisseria cinerea]|uniref:YadA-like family protein n=1 Tax=Neisseria cinerea TaxID=483 RepID=UPI000D3B7386|nr:YadA-like family protein [Neisseria cinerea]